MLLKQLPMYHLVSILDIRSGALFICLQNVNRYLLPYIPAVYLCIVFATNCELLITKKVFVNLTSIHK